MEALLFLIPVSLLIAGLFLFLFYKASKSGQFDDLDTPAENVLLEDILEEKPASAKEAQSKNRIQDHFE